MGKTINYYIMHEIVQIVIPLSAFAMVFGIVYLGITSSHREKMAMIEAGMNPNESKNVKHIKLRSALLLIFVPLGILVGNMVGRYTEVLEQDESGLIFAFLFGGIGLTLAYWIEKRPTSHDSDKLDY